MRHMFSDCFSSAYPNSRGRADLRGSLQPSHTFALACRVQSREPNILLCRKSAPDYGHKIKWKFCVSFLHLAPRDLWLMLGSWECVRTVSPCATLQTSLIVSIMLLKRLLSDTCVVVWSWPLQIHCYQCLPLLYSRTFHCYILAPSVVILSHLPLLYSRVAA